ncbi:MAG TPA: fumarylacetoacetate hydrolase family protein [Casimicrobiaceae bacterium]|nr:fumarylacetoacetate hydrolase family protein [Casimicrobiaceae bacterium]
MSARVPEYLEPLRDALLRAHRTRTPVDVSGLPVPHGDSDAYAVQRALAADLRWFGTRPAAWKVGSASRNATPSAAPIASAVVRASPATFGRGTFNRIIIEGEIAFRLAAPLHAAAQDVSAAIGELVVTIEVVDPRYSDMDAAAPLSRLADQLLNGALVVGSSVPWRGSLDWGAQVAIVRRNGTVVKETRGGHPLGDLVFLLRWLAQHAEAEGTPLAAGDLVTAGTWTGVYDAAPGESIDVEFPGIGHASARFE